MGTGIDAKTPAKSRQIGSGPTETGSYPARLPLTAKESDAWLTHLEAGKDAEPPSCHDRQACPSSGYTLAELRALVQDGIDSGPAPPFDPESIDHEGRRLLKLVEARHD